MKQKDVERFNPSVFLYGITAIIGASPLYLNVAWHLSPFELLTFPYLLFNLYVSCWLAKIFPTFYGRHLFPSWFGGCGPRGLAGAIALNVLWVILICLIFYGIRTWAKRRYI